MKLRSIQLLILPGCLVSAAWAQPKIFTFDAPGAGTAANRGTAGVAIDPAGAITGFYFDNTGVTSTGVTGSGVAHGFLRTPDGTIVTFDAPGAGNESVNGFHPTPAGVFGGQGTFSLAINPAEAITGTYFDSTNTAHGFLRTSEGTITTVDAPSYVGTFARNISPTGAIAGITKDGNAVFHGFLRSPAGEFTIFNAPGAGAGPGQGTLMCAASCINAAEAVTGWYVDGNGVSHGYVRAPWGVIATFDAPGAGKGAGQGTFAYSIDDWGVVTGSYIDASGVNHGYVREPGGLVTTFDAPGAGTSSGQGTSPEGVNDAGEITGQYVDAKGANHGFVRDFDGRFTTFNAPGAGTGSGQGTLPTTNNFAGKITGAYTDGGYVLHGFLLTIAWPWNW